jgi:hypothetical protein
MIFRYRLSEFGRFVIIYLLMLGFCMWWGSNAKEDQLKEIKEACEKENYYKEKFLFIKCKNVLVKEEKVLDF